MVANIEAMKGGIMNDEKPRDGNRRNSRLNRKLRGRIARYLLNINIDNVAPQELIEKLHDFLQESESPQKLQAAGFDVQLLISSEFRLIVGEERCQCWRRVLLDELAEEMQGVARKMHSCNSEKKRAQLGEKFFAQKQRLMDDCLFLGVEWEEIQELLDETINNEY